MQLEPNDEHNRSLLEQLRPDDWKNPTPRGRYNLVAIGGGAAGLVSALGAAGLGARAALVERRLLGGDCLNFGCVPSKALLRAARAAHEARTATRYGVRFATPPTVDFAQVMERLRRVRAQIAPHDSASRVAQADVDLYLGSARFTGPDRVEVEGRELWFRRAVIATGGRPVVPDIPGLDGVAYLTNETIFSLTELPRRLLIVGAGAVGCELAQAFARLGSEVHLCARGDRVLPGEHPEASRLVADRLRTEGVRLHLGVRYVAARKQAGETQLELIEQGQPRTHVGDALLVAAGRRASVDDLGLEAAGVRTDERGVCVDDRLRTSNPRIYAAGDVCGLAHHTHAADAMARLVLRNALFLGRRRWSRLVLPRCIFTDPEVAYVGPATGRESTAESPDGLREWRVELAEVDRAIVDEETEGFLLVRTRRGRMYDATLVAPHAGEMIGQLTLLIARRLSLAALEDVIHCYPTRSELIKQVSDEYQRSRLTGPAKSLLAAWLAFRR